MFTGVMDRDGEETVRSLGGEMVDSVFECTHLVTDKVLSYSVYLIMTCFQNLFLNQCLCNSPQYGSVASKAFV